MGEFAVFWICLMFGFLPFEMMGYLGSSLLSVAKLLGIGALIAGAMAFLSGHPIRSLPPTLMVRIALWVWVAMSMGWSLDQGMTWDDILRQSNLLVFSILIWEFATTYGRLLWLYRALLVGMLVPLAMQFSSYRLSEGSAAAAEERFSGGGHDANYLALMFGVSIVVAGYLSASKLPLDRYLRWAYWTFLVLLIVGMGLTGSRAGFVCLFIALGFGGLAAGVSFRKLLQLGKYAVPILGAAVAFYKIVPAILQSRLTEVQLDSGTFGLRWGYWVRGLTISWINYPLTGVGAGAYQPATTRLSGIKTGVAHNILISVLVELGVVGFVLFVTFLYLTVRAAGRMPWREKMLAWGVLAVWFVGSLSAGSQHEKLGWFIQTMVLAQAAICIQPRTAKRHSPYPNRGAPMIRGPLRPRLGPP